MPVQFNKVPAALKEPCMAVGDFVGGDNSAGSSSTNYSCLFMTS